LKTSAKSLLKIKSGQIMKKQLLLLVCFSISVIFAIEPPAKGVKVPAGFAEWKKEVEKSYSTGYYAEKFKDRAALRQQMAEGFIPKGVIAKDTIKVLTLLGNYSDVAPVYTEQNFQTKLFDGPNSTGTISQFYEEISYHQLHIVGKCIGWFGLPGTKYSYVDTTQGRSVHGGPQFVYDLVQAADKTVNFADYIQYYDASGNPHIAFIAAIHPGGDAAAGADNIWSHKWTFGVITDNQPYTTNDIDPKSGKYVLIDGNYALEPEMKGSKNTGGAISEIGVFAHEFGHTFGLPDLYDTDNSSEGIGEWCLMASGSWGGNGQTPETPTHMSAWCKQRLGWITPTVITSYQKDFTVSNVEQNPIIYKMWKKNKTGSLEYFLIENRQAIGFDKNIHGSGLLVFHVDDSQSSNTNENHYWVDVVQADGKRDLNLNVNRGDGGDIYPGTSNNTTLDYLSTPNTNAYSKDTTYVSIRNIRTSQLNMVADFDIGTQPLIKFKSISVTESIPDNGRIEQGETADIAITLSNIQPVASKTTTIQFEIDDPQITVLKPLVTDSVSALSQKTITIPAVFKVNAGFVSKILSVKYTITSETGVIADSVKIIVGIPQVLVVSKAERSDLISYYETAFLNAGIYPELVSGAAPSFYNKRKTVVYLSGTKTDSIFTAAEVDSLVAFINQGGNLFLSGQNFAEYLTTAYPSFLSDQIGISWVKNKNFLTTKAYGIASDIFGSKDSVVRINGGEGAQNEKSPDVISSNGAFTMSFAYNANGTDGAGGWIQKASGAKIFFLGFGFESMNNNESSLTREKFAANLLNGFGNVSAVRPDKASDKSFRLYDNYPNPFNPSTVIQYAVPSNGKVSLVIYDILGNKVATLVNEVKPSGTYQSVFDPSTYRLASGVYFYRLEIDGARITKKMMYMK
jgi:M6 family metalloprotease-like protein